VTLANDPQARILAGHTMRKQGIGNGPRETHSTRDHCRKCGERWPCDAYRLARTVEEVKEYANALIAGGYIVGVGRELIATIEKGETNG